tara:strand:- start:407 stop:535 length:129 start_codon:yes stop_codon:yes gene_type:complete
MIELNIKEILRRLEIMDERLMKLEVYIILFSNNNILKEKTNR